MATVRRFADSGRAVVVVAAVARSRDSKGRSSYGEGLNLASFRESSELEFGADDAFLLLPDPEGDGSTGRVVLKHLKSRHGELRDVVLDFDRGRQTFTPVTPDTASRDDLMKALRAQWQADGGV
jgi:replicative DNA helicase